MIETRLHPRRALTEVELQPVTGNRRQSVELQPLSVERQPLSGNRNPATESKRQAVLCDTKEKYHS